MTDLPMMTCCCCYGCTGAVCGHIRKQTGGNWGQNREAAGWLATGGHWWLGKKTSAWYNCPTSTFSPQLSATDTSDHYIYLR